MARARRLDEQLDDAARPDLAVALVLGDAVQVHLRGAPTADARFAWGSITKTVTGTLLALLAAEGVVRLDQPASELLPGAPPLLLADLASHTSGLPRLLPGSRAYVRSHVAVDPYAEETPERLLAALAQTRLRRPRVRYSNAGAGLLGLALVTATGTSYDALVRDHVARPLGLTTLSSELPGVAGHDRRGRVVPPWSFTDAMAGCGALAGSVRDLARWLRAAGGQAPEPLAAALAVATTPRAANRLVEVGLGWHRSVPGGAAGLRAPRDGEAPWVWHNGGTSGFTAFAGLDTGSGRGVAVLSGSSRSVDPLGVELLRSTRAWPGPDA